MGADLYGYKQDYFRDSYNDSSLLWQFGLSWFEDVIPLLDDNHELHTHEAKLLLRMLASQKEVFEQNMKECTRDERSYFRQRYKSLKHFLQKAIEAQVSIKCSL